MEIRKTVCPFPEIGEVVLLYSSGEYPRMDSQTLVYTMRKLSVLLTDDLAAVVGDDVFNTVRGDFFVFNPSELHHGRFLRSGLHRFLDFYLPLAFFDRLERLFPGSAAGPSGLFLGSEKPRRNLVQPDGVLRASVLSCTERLAVLAKEHPGEDDHAADLLIFSLLIGLLDVCAAAYDAQRTSPPLSAVPAVVSTAVRYINGHYAEPVSLEMLAALAGCSVTYLTRAFRRHTGRTVHSYLTERRIAAAQQLLLGGAAVTEACYGAGFGDCSSFIRAFRRSTGTTPGRYGAD